MSDPTYPLEGRLPETLSHHEIISVLDEAPKMGVATMSRQIAQISSTLVVKFGTTVHTSEANAMLYAATMPDIRAPKVFDVWESPTIDTWGLEATTTYILMQFVPGTLVSDAWPTLTPQDRLDVFAQIRDMLTQMQKTSFDQPGPLGGGIAQGAYFSDYGAGPFPTRKALEDWFDERLWVLKHFKRGVDGIKPFTGTFNELVFCHQDLHAHNIILDRDGRVWLLDWGRAGAYPPYFERACLRRQTVDTDFTRPLAEYLDDGKYAEEIKKLECLGFALTTGRFAKPKIARGVNTFPFIVGN